MKFHSASRNSSPLNHPSPVPFCFDSRKETTSNQLDDDKGVLLKGGSRQFKQYSLSHPFYSFNDNEVKEETQILLPHQTSYLHSFSHHFTINHHLHNPLQHTLNAMDLPNDGSDPAAHLDPSRTDLPYLFKRQPQGLVDKESYHLDLFGTIWSLSIVPTSTELPNFLHSFKSESWKLLV